jgi:alkylation response protein AidB-like acyl-CoA dehydrogenase
MSFVADADQRELVTSVRRFLVERSLTPTVRELAESGSEDARLWRTAAEQLGLPSLAVPEVYGGQGFGPVELGLVFEELGRALVCAPFLSTCALAVPAILASGDEVAAKELLPAILDGSGTATLALPLGTLGGSGPLVSGLHAEHVGEAWTVSGVTTFVLDGHTAGLLLVVAETADGPSLLAVEASAAGVHSKALQTLDLTRRQALVELEGASARVLGAPGSACAILEPVLDQARALLAMEQVGGATRCLDMAVEYTGQRAQFGRLIGSFQAVKHKLADMWVAVESARSLAYHAVWAAQHSAIELPVAASMAQAAASEAFCFAAAECVHLHGGIGFTWEHDAHLYFRRAHADAVLLGDADFHRERVARLLEW